MKTITTKNLLKGYYYINDNINEKNFPLPKTISTTGAKVIEMGKSFSSQEALGRIKAEGCRPATIWELAQWKIENEDKIKGKYKWYLALGSVWKYVADGDHRVPYVSANSSGGFNFNLGYFEDDWDDDDCLLCFCDLSLNTKDLEKTQSLDSLTLRQKLEKYKKADLKCEPFNFTAEYRLGQIRGWNDAIEFISGLDLEK